MNDYYCLFNSNINKQALLDLFSTEQNKGMLQKEKTIYSCVDPGIVMMQGAPALVDIDYELNKHDVMLAMIDGPTRLHCNPGNNGLLIVPLAGKLNFDFYSYQPAEVDGITRFSAQDETQEVIDTLVHSLREIDQPIAFNGRLIHSYWPTETAIFYARKIPLTRTWEQVTQKLS